MCLCENKNECDETPTTWDDIKVCLTVLGILFIFALPFILIGYHG